MPLAAHHCNVLRLVINAISQTYPNESLIKLLLAVTDIKELLGEGAGSPSCSYHVKTSGVAFKMVLAAPGLSHRCLPSHESLTLGVWEHHLWNDSGLLSLNGEQAPQAMEMTNSLRFAFWGKYVSVCNYHNKLTFMRTFLWLFWYLGLRVFTSLVLSFLWVFLLLFF